MVASGFLFLWNSHENQPYQRKTYTTATANTVNAIAPKNTTAVAISIDSNGNIFVLWSNGQVFEHPDLTQNNWIYLGNASGIGSVDNGSVNLGNPVGIRASYNWQSQSGATVGLVMVLFSNGYASYLEYGVSPHAWVLTKLPSGNNYVALSYDLNAYYYLGAKKEVFYATEGNGITYGFSDNYYAWQSIISTPVSHNITAALAWPNNFAPPTLGTTVLYAISRDGYIYFAQGSVDPLQPLAWVNEGQIHASNPDFIGITQTSNPYSAYYYYAIQKGSGTDLYGSATFNGSASSYSPINPTPTGTANHTALQNDYFGFDLKSNELILLQNGQIYQTTTEGTTFDLYLTTPMHPAAQKQINVMPWIYQTGPGTFNGKNRLKASLSQLNTTHNNYTMVSYEFYQLQASGSITALTTGSLSYSNSSNPNNITPFVHKLGLGAVPMIISASAGQIYNFTVNQSKMNAAISQMAKYALEYNYTGYDIDWEPSSSNTTTGALFTSFVNQFSMTLNKFGKKLFVEVANWDPNFWNYAALGRTNVTSINIMDYVGSYSGAGSFLADMQQGISQIPSGKLSISLETLNPNTNLNFTALQMQQRFLSLEQNNIKFLGIWDLPLNYTLESQVQDFEANYTGQTFSTTFTPGSSGIAVVDNGGVTSNSITFSYGNNAYLNGAANASTNFAGTSSLKKVSVTNNGTMAVVLFAQTSSGWQKVQTISASTTTAVALPSGAQNIEFSFGGFNDVATTSSYSGTLNYTLKSSAPVSVAWIDVYYLNGASVYLNGASATGSVTGFGQWNVVNLSVAPGIYNVSSEKLRYNGSFDRVNAVSGTTADVYLVVTITKGTLTGTVSPAGASVTVNGLKLTLTNGVYNFTSAPGTYTLKVTMNYYVAFEKNVTIKGGETTYENVTLAYEPPQPVLLYVPSEVNNTTFQVSWLRFVGVDFTNYSVYLSGNSGSLGKFVTGITHEADTTYNITGLSSNTTYYVTIVTYAQNGNADSNVVNFTTPAVTPNHGNTATSPLSSTDLYVIVGVVAAVVVIGVAAVVLRKRNKN